MGAARETRKREAPRAAAPGARRLWRGFALGLALLPPNALWLIYLESFRGTGPHFSCISLFLNVILIMAFVALGNAAARRVAPRLTLNRGELTIVYVMLTIGTSVAGHDMLQVLMPIISSGHWYANPQNRWDQMIDASTPAWLVISDKAVLYGLWNGSSTLYSRPVIDAWSQPILWWTGFTVVLVFVMACLSVLLRPLWAERERLTFPIIQLPLELTNPETPLLRNRLLWLGFGAAALFDLLNAPCVRRALPAYRPMPILFNEDDHYDFDQPMDNMVAAVREHASWGYHDKAKGDERDGYRSFQSPPVDWAISTDRRKAFLDLVREITGT